MSEATEMREKIIATINTLSEQQLKDINALITKFVLQEHKTIDEIYNEAAKKYNITLQNLAD